MVRSVSWTLLDTEMRAALVLFGLAASALAATTPVVPPYPMMDSDVDVGLEKCTQRCTGYWTVNPTYVQPCLASCNINLGKKIEETLARLTTVKEPTTADDFKMLYRDGMMLQNQLYTLKKAVQQQPIPPIFSALFPNLGFFPPPNTGVVQTPFAAPAQPQYPGILMQITETITNLLNQVIKRQQEILQMIIGCNCTSETPEVTTTTTAAPPPATVVSRVDVVVPVVPVKTPVVPVKVPVTPVKVPEVPVKVPVVVVPEVVVPVDREVPPKV